jgi:hypothetical protein
VNDVSASAVFKVAGISISPPAVVAAGPAQKFTVTSTEGFDLSVPGTQATISPRDGISNIAVTNPTSRGLTVSFDLASGARPGDRTLTITGSNISAAANFKVVGIDISAPSVVATGPSAKLVVTSSEGFDLSDPNRRVSFSPPDDISNITVSNETMRGLTLMFDVASSARGGSRKLIIKTNNVSASADFKVVGISVSPPSVGAGGPARLTVTSSGDFDLSHVRPDQVSFTPGGDISNVNVSEASQTRLTLLFNLANSCQAQSRKVAVKVNDVSASASFGVTVLPSGINVSHIHVDTSDQDSCRPILSVVSCDFNFSQVSLNDVSISPGDIGLQGVSDQTQTGLTVSLVSSSTPPSSKARTLSIRSNNVVKTTSFSVRVRPQRPGCPADKPHCCSNFCNGVCATCQRSPFCQ